MWTVFGDIAVVYVLVLPHILTLQTRTERLFAREEVWLFFE